MSILVAIAPMSVSTLLFTALGLWLILAVAMVCAWLIEQRTGNSGWVDVVWTAAIGLAGIIGAMAPVTSPSISSRQLLLAGLIFIWAARLAGHIAVRTRSVSDDPRYEKLRDSWGGDAARNMFWLLQAEAALGVPMVLAVTLAAWNPAPLFTSLDAVALVLFALALSGSAIADATLARFKRAKRAGETTSEVCDQGLWAWSRHPNYFFEVLIWLALALFAIDPTGAWPAGYVALLGPACIYWLLRYVSGVPPLEQHMVAKYGAAYTRYQQSTSAFVLWPPKPPPPP